MSILLRLVSPYLCNIGRINKLKNMKKLFLIPLMLLATFMLTAACSEDNPPTDGQEQTTPEEDDGEEGNEGNNEEGENVEGGNGRYLVLYCSRTGNTERMAQTIQSTLDCDMIVVEPETPYEDDYNAMLDRAQAELDAIAQGNYPAITTSVESFDEYDIVFIGYPIWYGHIATPMQTFLHNHAELLGGKHIALFASSGSSGIGTSERDAATLVPDAVFEEFKYAGQYGYTHPAMAGKPWRKPGRAGCARCHILAHQHHRGRTDYHSHDGGQRRSPRLPFPSAAGGYIGGLQQRHGKDILSRP